jgi:hypothetical protein
MKNLRLMLLSSMIFAHAPVMASDHFNSLDENLKKLTIFYLDIKSLESLRGTNKSFKKYIDEMTKHLHPHPLLTYVKDYLQNPTEKVPFYYLPKSVKKIFGFPCFRSEILNLFLEQKEKKSAVASLFNTFLSFSLKERDFFLQECCNNLDLIDLLKTHPDILNNLQLNHFQESIQKRIEFLTTLTNVPGYDKVSFVGKQTDQELKVVGYYCIIKDKKMSLLYRLDAVKALIKLGGEFKSYLLSIVQDQTETPWFRKDIAMAMGELGPEFKSSLGPCLFSIVQNQTETPEFRKDIAMAMGKLSPEFKRNLGPCLLSIVQDQTETPWFRKDIAMAMGELGPEFKSSLGPCLLSIAQNQTEIPWFRKEIAMAMGELGPEFKSQQREALFLIIIDPLFDNPAKIDVVNTLFKLDIDQLSLEDKDTMAKTLLTIISDPKISSSEQGDMAQNLEKLGTKFKSHQIYAHASIARNTKNSDNNIKLESVRTLIKLAPDRQNEWAEILLSMTSNNNNNRDKINIVKVLIKNIPEYKNKGLDILRSIATNKQIEYYRLDAAELLVEEDHKYMEECKSVVASILNNIDRNHIYWGIIEDLNNRKYKPLYEEFKTTISSLHSQCQQQRIEFLNTVHGKDG